MPTFPFTSSCALRTICLLTVLMLSACAADHSPFGPPQIITNEDGPL
jgi:hypothetical protein